MDKGQPALRVTEAHCRETVIARDDENVVLRLAREPLRSNPPTVRFVERAGEREPPSQLPGHETAPTTLRR
jgi:hypothetical protein